MEKANNLDASKGTEKAAVPTLAELMNRNVSAELMKRSISSTEGVKVTTNTNNARSSNHSPATLKALARFGSASAVNEYKNQQDQHGNSSNNTPSDKPEPLPLPGTDWELWAHMPKATLTEAVAVSLGIDPSALNPGSGYAEPGKEFDRRLKLACAYVSHSEPLKSLDTLPPMHLFGGPAIATVSLPAFAKWALGMGWDIPEQFPRFKAAPPQAAPVTTKSASTGNDERRIENAREPANRLEIRDRLLLIARDRLRNRPGAYRQFQHAIENTIQGVSLTFAAQDMPMGYQIGEEWGDPKASQLISEHLTRIVDKWAHSQPLPPAVEPLPGTAPLQISPVSADAQGITRSPAPEVAESALGGVEQTPDPERRLALLRALGGSAKYARGEWKFTGTGALVAREKADSRRRSDEKTIRADLKEGAQAERDARTAGVFNGLGQR